MQLDEMREQLRELAARVPAGSITASDVLGRAQRATKRRRATRGIAALAAVVVIGTLAVVLNVAKPAPKIRVSVETPSTAVPTSKTPKFTAAQLRAHIGVGVPNGWGPVDVGDARVWVPTFWYVATAGTRCPGGTVPHTVSIGALVPAHCGRTGEPAHSVSLIPTSHLRLGELARVVHGYRVYNSTAPTRSGLHIYDVPELGIELAFRGSLSDRILGSLAPSGRMVALAFADQPPPTGTRTVTAYGVTLSIPSTWPEPPPGASCGLSLQPGLFRFSARNEGVVSCPYPVPFVGTREGVELYPSNEFGKQPLPPIAVLRHGTTIVSVFGVPRQGDELEVQVHLDGSERTHDLLFGLGRDARVAGGILASIRAVA